MANLNGLLHNPQAAQLLSDQKKLEELRNAPETQQLFSMLQKSTSGDLEQAANHAAQGDSASLVSAIRKLMRDPEGAKLMEKMKQHLNQ
ncbi:hypothetical protein B5F98_08290 [Pseudoflavonifractor sp. An44]|uniref:hypothetical protein n=1 Tax=Pseudoflavonifractor sp. An44 TaxID=1965635 RepID=UPI000B38119F|nr:hypothetical protein [Pseudoflavonifractor sp. An44]OUN96083.1 hypothetical protein B5F98_08290 [Pseudoflavonifractor sp. An44]